MWLSFYFRKITFGESIGPAQYSSFQIILYDSITSLFNIPRTDWQFYYVKAFNFFLLRIIKLLILKYFPCFKVTHALICYVIHKKMHTRLGLFIPMIFSQSNFICKCSFLPKTVLENRVNEHCI